jgi:hypothetical protein
MSSGVSDDATSVPCRHAGSQPTLSLIGEEVGTMRNWKHLLYSAAALATLALAAGARFKP